MESISNKRILVTGGAGFIGSSLIRRLIRANEVVSLDNYSMGSIDNHVDGASYLKGDASQINELLPEQKFDYVFHFGEYSRVEQSFNETFRVLKCNSAMLSILQFSKMAGAKLIYSCSSTVFNDTVGAASLSPYTLSKKNNVQLLKNIALWEELPYSIVYFYNAYGPNEIARGPYATVVAKFLQLRESGQRVAPVTHPGTQRRSFTYIEDIVAGILLAAEKGYGDGYGIGSDRSFSILELCELIGLEPEFSDPARGNRMNTKVDNEKIKSLGWCESMTLEQYIDNYSKKA